MKVWAISVLLVIARLGCAGDLFEGRSGLRGRLIVPWSAVEKEAEATALRNLVEHCERTVLREMFPEAVVGFYHLEMAAQLRSVFGAVRAQSAGNRGLSIEIQREGDNAVCRVECSTEFMSRIVGDIDRSECRRLIDDARRSHLLPAVLQIELRGDAGASEEVEAWLGAKGIPRSIDFSKRRYASFPGSTNRYPLSVLRRLTPDQLLMLAVNSDANSVVYGDCVRLFREFGFGVTAQCLVTVGAAVRGEAPFAIFLRTLELPAGSNVVDRVYDFLRNGNRVVAVTNQPSAILQMFEKSRNPNWDKILASSGSDLAGQFDASEFNIVGKAHEACGDYVSALKAYYGSYCISRDHPYALGNIILVLYDRLKVGVPCFLLDELDKQQSGDSGLTERIREAVPCR